MELNQCLFLVQKNMHCTHTHVCEILQFLFETIAYFRLAERLFDDQ